jgi:hypothetical protein
MRGLVRQRAGLLVAIWLAACPIQAASSNKASRNKAAAVAVLKKVAFLLEHPASITSRELENRFPGRYIERPCTPAESLCGYDNAGTPGAPVLSGYVVVNSGKSAAGVAQVNFDFPRHGGCVTLKELDALLGQRGKWTGVPPPPDFFGGPMHRMEDIRYEGSNVHGPMAHARAMLNDGCLTQFSIDLEAMFTPRDASRPRPAAPQG